MSLNSWQKISRVLPGMPFGTGEDGPYSSTIPTLVKDSLTGTAASKSVTTSGSSFANGNVVLIHQTRGTGAGQWEINRVASGGGTSSLTMQEALKYTYTDSGASQAQIIKVFQYTTVTQSGTWTVAAWDGNTGGIFPIAARNSMSISGTITGTGRGFRGSAASQNTSNQGEGTGGAGSAIHTPNGDGAGGAGANQAGGRSGGAGGGHAAAGSNGPASTAPVAQGGSADGSQDLTDLVLSGAGSGAGGTDSGGAGGNGGGSFIIFAKDFTVTGALTSGGNNGGNAGNGGGGGAGGAILVESSTATLGTNKLTAAAGSGGSGGETNGGAGSVGRIHLDYAISYSGTSSPTLNVSKDVSLIESGGAALFAMA